MAKMKEYLEKHQQGSLSVEQTLVTGIKECDFGIRIAKDGRVWVCINGEALLRFKPSLRKEGLVKKGGLNKPPSDRRLAVPPKGQEGQWAMSRFSESKCCPTCSFLATDVGETKNIQRKNYQGKTPDLFVWEQHHVCLRCGQKFWYQDGNF